MGKLSFNTQIGVILLCGLMLFVSSCDTAKNVVYFSDITEMQMKSEYANVEPVIQVNDILSIIVSSLDKDASAVFNAPNESSFNTNTATAATNRLTIGYLVNNKGDIQFPILGTIHAAGLTKYQLTETLTNQLKSRKLLVEPIVTIRHLNYRVSVMGEVARPGVFSVPNEKLNLLEALSFAGDITIYGRKDNILLIREDDKGEKTIKRLDLTNKEVLTSPYYYLKSNDIVYVQPLQNRLGRERATQTLPIVLSALSLLIIGLVNLK